MSTVGGSPAREPLGSRWLWVAFLLVHLAVVLLAVFGPGRPLGDVEVVYRGWAEQAASGTIVGIDQDFVYPLLALAPMAAALSFGAGAYLATWFGLVTLVNAGAFWVLLRGGSGRCRLAAWWWLGFLLLLGPIALVRIDGVTTPLVIVALLGLRRRPRWGAALLAVATWVKIWPVAALAALFVTSKDRWQVLLVAAAVSGGIVGVALASGGGAHVFSFVFGQTDRGIQIESPIALPWLWQVAAQVPGSAVYYDHHILTFQVAGPGVGTASALMTPLLALAVLAVLLLGYGVIRRGGNAAQAFAPLTLALTVTLIAFNKVGSPQFIGWLAAPVIIGLVLHGRAWRTSALLAGALAALTQIIFPYLYDWVLAANAWMVLALTVRNLLEFVLLGWAAHQLWTYAGSSRQRLSAVASAG